MKWFVTRGWWYFRMPVCLAVLLLSGLHATHAAAEGLTDKLHELMREQELREQQKPRPQQQPVPPRPNPGQQPEPRPGRKPPNAQPQVTPAPPPPPPMHRPAPDRRPQEIHRDDHSSHRRRPEHDWRRDRCWELWGGSGSSYRRCLDGRHEYLYPGYRYERAPAVILEAQPPPVIRYREPDLPDSLQAERFPVWYAPRVAPGAVVIAQDSDRIDRRFHLIGVQAGDSGEYLEECLARNLNDARVQVNEIVPFSSTRGADAEAVIFIRGTTLNAQVLAEGCAQFDDQGCREFGLDICDALLEAEYSARRSGLGIWR